MGYSHVENATTMSYLLYFLIRQREGARETREGVGANGKEAETSSSASQGTAVGPVHLLKFLLWIVIAKLADNTEVADYFYGPLSRDIGRRG